MLVSCYAVAMICGGIAESIESTNGANTVNVVYCQKINHVRKQIVNKIGKIIVIKWFYDTYKHVGFHVCSSW